MANNVRISALGEYPLDVATKPKNFSVYKKEVIAHLQGQIDNVLREEPDLIVFHECADWYWPHEMEELREFYKYLGDSIEEYLKPIAINNNLNMAYSAVRYVEPESDKPFRNSTIYIGRDGKVNGIYDKNFVTQGESEILKIAYGDKAELIELDFGKVASAICFDLNFDELMYKFAEQNPDLIVFCSTYHGGLRQAQWAYTCRSYFVGAIMAKECTILSPFGEKIAASTTFTHHTTATVNLDYVLCHHDFNADKIYAAKEKYRSALTIHDPGNFGSCMLTCNDPDMTVHDILKEFDIETLDEYFNRTRAHRKANILL